MAGVEAATLASVFTSSGGDGLNCHEICQVLASADRQLSPTRFHNSVHNAAAGYWSIATGATAAANALCAHDASFGAGLLEALCQVAVEERCVLLIAYDASYPEPLRSAGRFPTLCGVALLLAPRPARVRGAHARPGVSTAAADRLPQAAARTAAHRDAGGAQPAAAARSSRGAAPGAWCSITSKAPASP